jgi:hypothetical protein
MIRFASLFVCSLAALAVIDGPAAGQAMVEYSLGAARAVGAAGAAKGLGKSVSGAFGALEKTLPQSQSITNTGSSGLARPSAHSRTRRKPAAPRSEATATKMDAPPAQPARRYEDPSQIPVGMGYEELLGKFGPPVLEFTTGPSSKTLSYLGKSGAVQIELVQDKVSSAQKPKL